MKLRRVEALEAVDGQQRQVAERAERPRVQQRRRVPEQALVVVHVQVLEPLLVRPVQAGEQAVARRADGAGKGPAKGVGLDAGGLEFAKERVERVYEAGSGADVPQRPGVVLGQGVEAVADDPPAGQFMDAADRPSGRPEEPVGQVGQRQDLRAEDGVRAEGGEQAGLGGAAAKDRRHEHQRPARPGLAERVGVCRQDAGRLAAARRADDQFDGCRHADSMPRADRV